MVPIPLLLYYDDRLFVLDINVARVERYTDQDAGTFEVSTMSRDLATGGEYHWTLTTRGNHTSYPPSRVDRFESLDKLIAYVRKVEPETPRISLDRDSPDPVPSYEEYLDWLADNGLQGAIEQKLRCGGYFTYPEWRERLVWEAQQLSEHLGVPYPLPPREGQ